MSESRMAKILKRLTGKDEESQDLKDKEEKMTKLNLDLGDISGETVQTHKVIDENPTQIRTIDEAPFANFNRKSCAPSYLKPVKEKTFEDRLEETFICFIEDGKVVSRELKEATAEEFCTWVNWVYPAGEDFLEKNKKHYEKYENRKAEFLNLVAFLTRLPKVFKAYGESSFLPQKDEKKTDKKAGGKNE
jgi:hypothetical protein